MTRSSILDDLDGIAKRTREIQKEENREPISTEIEDNRLKISDVQHCPPFISLEDAPETSGTILYFLKPNGWRVYFPFERCEKCEYRMDNKVCKCVSKFPCEIWWCDGKYTSPI